MIVFSLLSMSPKWLSIKINEKKENIKPGNPVTKYTLVYSSASVCKCLDLNVARGCGLHADEQT